MDPRQVQVGAWEGRIETKRLKQLDGGIVFRCRAAPAARAAPVAGASAATEQPSPVSVMGGRFVRRHLNGAADLLARLVDPAHLNEQLAEIEQRDGRAGILAQPGQIMSARL